MRGSSKVATRNRGHRFFGIKHMISGELMQSSFRDILIRYEAEFRKSLMAAVFHAKGNKDNKPSIYNLPNVANPGSSHIAVSYRNCVSRDLLSNPLRDILRALGKNAWSTTWSCADGVDFGQPQEDQTGLLVESGGVITLYLFTSHVPRSILVDEKLDRVVVCGWNYRTADSDEAVRIIVNGCEMPVSVKSFMGCFDFILGKNEAESFFVFAENAAGCAQDFIGLRTIRALSPNEFGLFRLDEEEAIGEWIKLVRSHKDLDQKMKHLSGGEQSMGYAYNVIDQSNRDDYPTIEEDSKSLIIEEEVLERFESADFVKCLVGSSDFAKCFMSSEHLFSQHDCADCIDYTSIVSGYLKSVEQLLFSLALFYIDGDLKMKYSSGRNRYGDKPWYEWVSNCKMIDFTTENLPCLDATMGSLWHFFEGNASTLLEIGQEKQRILVDCLKLYSQECRNDAFHKHNIDRWSRVELIRHNTLYLLIVLLSLFRFPVTIGDAKVQLGCIDDDRLERLYHSAIRRGCEAFEFHCEGGAACLRVSFRPDKTPFPIFEDSGLMEPGSYLVFADNDAGSDWVLNRLSMPVRIIARGRGERSWAI